MPLKTDNQMNKCLTFTVCLTLPNLSRYINPAELGGIEDQFEDEDNSITLNFGQLVFQKKKFDSSWRPTLQDN